MSAGKADGGVAPASDLPAVMAGLIATLISYAGPLVIIFQASEGLSSALVASWIWAISIGSGVLGILLSLRSRVPVVIAWSAPGSALLIPILGITDFAVAVGAYIVANALILAIGLTGMFDRVLRYLPGSVTAAMLAGILFRFVLDLAGTLPQEPLLVLSMIAVFVAVRARDPRYAVVAVLFVGCILTAFGGMFEGSMPGIELVAPVLTVPEFELQAVASISIPLAVVALTGQFLPGFAVLEAAGYREPAPRSVLSWCAAGSIALAPFGCHGLNLAALTAAICTGPEAHADPSRRWIAGVSGGVAYLLLGSFAGTVVALFALLPPALVAALAGLALFPITAASLANALRPDGSQDAALLTFGISVSGITVFGLGSAFLGLAAGIMVHGLRTVVFGLGRSLPAE